MLFVRSRISSRVAASAGDPYAIDSPFFDIVLDLDGLKRENPAAMDLGFHSKLPRSIQSRSPSLMRFLFHLQKRSQRLRQILAVNQKGVGTVGHQMVDEAVARKARLTLQGQGLPLQILISQ